jgi:hypothetical protein
MHSLIAFANLQERFEIYNLCYNSVDVSYSESVPVESIRDFIIGKKNTIDNEPFEFAELKIGNFSIEAEYFPEFNEVTCSLSMRVDDSGELNADGTWQRDDFLKETIDINASNIARELFRVLDEYVKENGLEYGVAALDKSKMKNFTLLIDTSAASAECEVYVFEADIIQEAKDKLTELNLTFGSGYIYCATIGELEIGSNNRYFNIERTDNGVDWNEHKSDNCAYVPEAWKRVDDWETIGNFRKEPEVIPEKPKKPNLSDRFGEKKKKMNENNSNRENQEQNKGKIKKKGEVIE